MADSVVLTGHTCNDEISLPFSVVLRPYGRSQRMRSKPLNGMKDVGAILDKYLARTDKIALSAIAKLERGMK